MKFFGAVARSSLLLAWLAAPDRGAAAAGHGPATAVETHAEKAISDSFPFCVRTPDYQNLVCHELRVLVPAGESSPQDGDTSRRRAAVGEVCVESVLDEATLDATLRVSVNTRTGYQLQLNRTLVTLQAHDETNYSVHFVADDLEPLSEDPVGNVGFIFRAHDHGFLFAQCPSCDEQALQIMIDVELTVDSEEAEPTLAGAEPAHDEEGLPSSIRALAQFGIDLTCDCPWTPQREKSTTPSTNSYLRTYHATMASEERHRRL